MQGSPLRAVGGALARATVGDKVLICCLGGAGVVEYLSNGGVADNHKDFKELRYNDCLSNFSCSNGAGGGGGNGGSVTHSFQLKSAYDSHVMPYTNYTYDFKVGTSFGHVNVCHFHENRTRVFAFAFDLEYVLKVTFGILFIIFNELIYSFICYLAILIKL